MRHKQQTYSTFLRKRSDHNWSQVEENRQSRRSARSWPPSTTTAKKVFEQEPEADHDEAFTVLHSHCVWSIDMDYTDRGD